MISRLIKTNGFGQEGLARHEHGRGRHSCGVAELPHLSARRACARSTRLDRLAYGGIGLSRWWPAAGSGQKADTMDRGVGRRGPRVPREAYDPRAGPVNV